MAKAFVYWNLRKECFSVKHKGRVIAHANRILMRRAEFRVSEAGRQRVLASGHKNVHAYIVCELDDLYYNDLCNSQSMWPTETNILSMNARERGARVRYNPYDAGYFQIASNSRPVDKADIVYGTRNLLDNQATLWAEGF